MRIRAFGELSVTDAGEEWWSVGGGLQATALAVLCVAPGESVSLDSLAEGLWGEHPPERFARSLATYMSNLRREFGLDIESTSNGYRLVMGRPAVDTCVFADQISTADADIERLENALALWVGEPFAGFEGHGLFRDERNRLHEAKVSAGGTLARCRIDAGEPDTVLPLLAELVEEFPYDERVRGLQMEALFRVGRQAEALKSYTGFRERLVEELGVEPSVELRDLELAVLNQDLPSLPGEATSRVPIPNRYSSFIGRSGDIAEVQERLGAGRLVSLVGPGGIGKSSIAVEAVRTWSGDLPVAVAPLDDVGQGDVAMQIAQHLGLQPASGVDPLDVVASFVRERPHLLILDGCEKRIGEVAEVVKRLLETTACQVLVTSREPVGLMGESVIRVSPLDVDEAVELFIDRAELAGRATAEDVAVVRDVCIAVDAMPLAVELAASRAASLPLERLASRLSEQIPLLRRSRGFDERHGSLLAALDWSFDLLREDEQATLATISVFRTPFDAASALALTQDPSTEDQLTRLVDVSLVRPPNEHGEYGMLEPIRQYARHQLETHDMAESALAQHREWVVSACRQAAIDEWTPRLREVRRWIYRKRPDLITAIDGATERNDPDTVLAIIASIGRHADRMWWIDDVLDNALSALDHANASRGRDWIRASSHVAWMLVGQGRWDEAEHHAQRAVECAELTSDVPALKAALQRLAVCSESVRNESSLQIMERAETLDGESMPESPAAMWQWNRAIVLANLDRWDEAFEAAGVVDRWYQVNIGTQHWALPLLESELKLHLGEPAQSMEAAEIRARLSEDELVYDFASDGWELAAFAAAIAGDGEHLATAVMERRRLSDLTGMPPHLPTEIAYAGYRGDHLRVLGLARKWFTERTNVDSEDIHLNLRDRDFAIYGSATDPPIVMDILPQLLPALFETGRGQDACRILAAMPALAEEAPYLYPFPILKHPSIADISRRCELEGGDRYDSLDLAGMYELVKQAVLESVEAPPSSS